MCQPHLGVIIWNQWRSLGSIMVIIGWQSPIIVSLQQHTMLSDGNNSVINAFCSSLGVVMEVKVQGCLIFTQWNWCSNRYNVTDRSKVFYRIEFWDGAQRAHMIQRREKDTTCQKAGMIQAFCHCSLYTSVDLK